MMVSSGDSPEAEIARGTSPADPARLDRLEHQVGELSGMIAALQHAQHGPAPAGGPAMGQAAPAPGHRPGAGPPAEDTLT